MPSVKVYNTKGAEVGQMELAADIFGCEYNEALIHQAVVAQLANARQGTKSALTRAEVRGGGIKPWRQKGTGRARQGSIRAPQWTKGGVVFAPKPRDFSQKMNVKARRGALKSALSYKVANDQFIVLDEFKLTAAKTKEVAQVLKNLKLDKSVLILTDGDANLALAARNIANVTVLEAVNASVYDVVRNAKILASKSAIEAFCQLFAKPEAEKSEEVNA